MFTRLLFILCKSRRKKEVSIPSSVYKIGLTYSQTVRMNGLRKNDIVIIKEEGFEKSRLIKNGLIIKVGEVGKGFFNLEFKSSPGFLGRQRIETKFSIDSIPLT